MESEVPSYPHLRAEGERLRRRLIDNPRSDDGLGALENEIQLWQDRCASAVAERSPGLIVDFHVQAGSGVRRQTANRSKPDSEVRLLESVAKWLRALHRSQLLAASEAVSAGPASAGQVPAGVPNPGY